MAIERNFSVVIESQGVRVLLALLSENVSGVDADSAQLSEYTQLLITELRKYPSDAFACAGTRRIVLATELSVGGERRAAVPATSGHALVLDPWPVWRTDDYPERALHHEFYHMLDRADSLRARMEAEWAAVNAPAFEYYGNGAMAYRLPGNQYRIRNPSLGFITPYALMAVEEDRAEVFSTLMVMRAEVHVLASSDPILRAKIDLLTRHLKRVCPSFLR